MVPSDMSADVDKGIGSVATAMVISLVEGLVVWVAFSFAAGRILKIFVPALFALDNCIEVGLAVAVSAVALKWFFRHR